MCTDPPENNDAVELRTDEKIMRMALELGNVMSAIGTAVGLLKDSRNALEERLSLEVITKGVARGNEVYASFVALAEELKPTN